MYANHPGAIGVERNMLDLAQMSGQIHGLAQAYDVHAFSFFLDGINVYVCTYTRIYQYSTIKGSRNKDSNPVLYKETMYRAMALHA